MQADYGSQAMPDKDIRWTLPHEVLPLLGLLGLIILFFWRYLFFRPTPLIYPVSDLGTDLPREIWPLARFIADTWHQSGRIPLWRPYLLSGAPLAGHPVAPILYPPHWLVLVLPISLALNLDAVLHLWWAAAGAFLFLHREEQLRQEAAFVGALVFGLSPPWMAHLSGGHWPMMAAIAWLPWAWLAARQLESKVWKKNALLLGIALAAQAMNHGAILIMTGLWLGTFEVGRILLSRSQSKGVVMTGWLLAIFVAASLAAGQLLPLFEILPLSSRSGLTLTEAGFAGLTPPMLLGIFLPPELQFPEWYLFPGVGVLLLASLGLRDASSGSRRWAWMILLSISLALIFSVPSIVEVFAGVPMLSMLRIPSRWWIFGLLGLAVLVAHGVEGWLAGRVSGIMSVGALPIALAAFYLLLGLLALVWNTTIPFETLLPAALAVLFLTLILFTPARMRLYALLALLLLEGYLAMGELIRPENEAHIREEAASMQGRLAAEGNEARVFAPYGGYSMAALAHLGWRAADGYDPLYFSYYGEVLNQAIGCDYPDYVVGVPATRASAEAARHCDSLVLDDEILWVLDVRYLLLPEDAGGEGLAPLSRMDGLRWFRRERGSAGRAFSVPGGLQVSAQTCASELAKLDLQKQAIVEAPLPATSDFRAFRIERLEGGPDNETFRVHAVSPGLFVRSETWAPGWGVDVDGVRREVLRVNCALQGVWLNPGEHRLRFFYAPASFQIGLAISALTALVLLGIGGWKSIGRWRFLGLARDGGAS